MKTSYIKTHIQALWLLSAVLMVLIWSFSEYKAQGKRYTLGDARITYLLLSSRCPTYSKVQVHYLAHKYGDYNNDGSFEKTNFIKWLEGRADKPCTSLKITRKDYEWIN